MSKQYADKIQRDMADRLAPKDVQQEVEQAGDAGTPTGDAGSTQVPATGVPVPAPTPVQQEAEQAWHRTHIGDEHSDEEQAEWEDGFLAAAKPRDQRIKELEEAIGKVEEKWGIEATLLLATEHDSAPPVLPSELFIRPEGCICTMFRDTGGFRVADLMCAVHGVDGTSPGDGLWEPNSPASLARHPSPLAEQGER
jgi:hypothetical protein